MKRLIFFGSLAGFLFLAIPISHAQTITPATSLPTLANVCSSVASTGNPPSGMSQSTLNGIETEMQSLSQVLSSLGTAVNVNGPSIAGVQGYNPTTKSYTDDTATPGTFLVLYGTFTASNNTVMIDGVAATPSYQSSNQINVPLTGIAQGYHIVSVITPSGATPPQLFTVGSSGSSASPQLTIDGATSATFTSTGSWSLSLAAGSAHANTAFTICATVNGNQTCTPNFGTTDANGNWTDSGSFSSANNGSWTEWVEFPDAIDSNHISFTVGSSATTTTPPPTTSSCTAGSIKTLSPSITVFATTALHMRSGPNTSANILGALSKGSTFTAVYEVCGQSYDGIALWWVTPLGDYIWSGGTEIDNGGGSTTTTTTTTIASSGPAPVLKNAEGYNPALNLESLTANTFPFYDTGYSVLVLYGTFASSGNTVNINGQVVPASDIIFQDTNQIDASVNSFINRSAPLPFVVSVTDANGTSASISMVGTAGVVASVGTNSQESCECDAGTAVCVNAGGGTAATPSDFSCGSTNDENPLGGGGEGGDGFGCTSDGGGGYICLADSN